MLPVRPRTLSQQAELERQLARMSDDDSDHDDLGPAGTGGRPADTARHWAARGARAVAGDGSDGDGSDGSSDGSDDSDGSDRADSTHNTPGPPSGAGTDDSESGEDSDSDSDRLDRPRRRSMFRAKTFASRRAAVAAHIAPRRIQGLHLHETLALCYLGCVWLRLPVTLADLLRSGIQAHAPAKPRRANGER